MVLANEFTKNTFKPGGGAYLAKATGGIFSRMHVSVFLSSGLGRFCMKVQRCLVSLGSGSIHRITLHSRGRRQAEINWGSGGWVLHTKHGFRFLVPNLRTTSLGPSPAGPGSPKPKLRAS